MKLVDLSSNKKRVPHPEFPNLLEFQRNSYNWLVNEGIPDLIGEISPIYDYSGNIFCLEFTDFKVGETPIDEKEAIRLGISYTVPLRAQATLTYLQTGEVSKQEIYILDIPVMTESGYFVINGVKKVVVSQLIKSPGVVFNRDVGIGSVNYGFSIVPVRGAWIDVEQRNQGDLTVRVNQGRAMNLFSFLQAFGIESMEKIKEIFRDELEITAFQQTMSACKDSVRDEALIELCKKLKPTDPSSVENGNSIIKETFDNPRKYSLGKVGRFKINRRLILDESNSKTLLSIDDLINITKELFRLIKNNLLGDDIDDLSFRRVKAVGEQVYEKLRTGAQRFERIVKERMSVANMEETVSPKALLNVKPMTAIVEDFFASAQLCQLLDDVNAISELAHKRRLSALGPGGLKRERAGLEVRDVHLTHYSRIDPVATPEGQNIGLVVGLSNHAVINEYGFIEVPFYKIIHEVSISDKVAEGLLTKEVKDQNGQVIIEKDSVVDSSIIEKLKKAGFETIPIRPLVTDEVEYFMSDTESEKYIAQADTPINEKSQITVDILPGRHGGFPEVVPVSKITHVDVSLDQMVSISTSLLPFVESNPTTRAMYGSNMIRQALPLIKTEPALTMSGLEEIVGNYSGHNIFSESDGMVSYVDAQEVRVKDSRGREKTYDIRNYIKTNFNTSISQSPVVNMGQKVKKGDILVNGYSMNQGILSTGNNVMVAFMPWKGYNTEDGIVISERLVKEDLYTSIYLEEHICNVRDTNLGPETITRDIPGRSEYQLRNLDHSGMVRVGAEVSSGDILVGKVTPRGHIELTPEERLLYAIFGDKARDVRDTSLHMPHGYTGKVISVQVLSRENGDPTEAGIHTTVKVLIGQLRKLTIGDKMANRHGHKGVVARVVPAEDMPFLEDGTPVDMVISPLGVFARANVGQILELHLSYAAHLLGHHYKVQCFSKISWASVQKELEKARLPLDGKFYLQDGMTGERFLEKVAVGYMYIQKLIHMSADKINARSVGSYSLITQQPLGGKAQHGGQRLGEMEVWALESHGAANILQEMLTVKSDDVVGRVETYEKITREETDLGKTSLPASFKVLINELKGALIKTDFYIPRQERETEELDLELY